MPTWSLPAKAAFTLLLFLLFIAFFAHSQPSHLTDGLATSSRIPSEIRNNLYDVHNQTLGFSKLLVISMPNRYDKHDLWSLAGLYTDITFEYVDGVPGDDIPEKAIPAGWRQNDPNDDKNTIGCYRGHMNAIQRIVNERLPSALIFEDDADWDVTIKEQLLDFARGARYLQDSNGLGLESPYGDDWDMLWLGHCGMKNREKEDARYWVTRDDPTVVPWTHRTNEPRWPNVAISPELQGNFTRLVYEPVKPLCAFAYALSLRGAEKMLYRYSVMPGATVWDLNMAYFCQDRYAGAKCIGVFPPLFESYRAPGDLARDSDRQATVEGQKFRKKGQTRNLAFSMKSNLDSFVMTKNIIKAPYKECLVPSIDRTKIELPQGKPVFLRKDDQQVVEGTIGREWYVGGAI